MIFPVQAWIYCEAGEIEFFNMLNFFIVYVVYWYFINNFLLRVVE